MGYAQYETYTSRRTIAYAVIVTVIITISFFFSLLFIYESNPTNITSTTTTTPTITTPPVIPNPHEVAIVFATGGLGDGSFNDMVFDGANRTHDDYNVNFTYSEPTTISEYESFLRNYAKHLGFSAPYEVIICIGFDQADALQVVAEEYPDQKFAIVDMYVNSTTYPNVASLLFNENEGAALVGAMAGLVTQTDKIGFIGGMDIPLINKCCAGYWWGANYTNPGSEFSIAYTYDWVDTTAGQGLADVMYADGVDVIYGVAGRSGLGVFTSAKTLNGTSGYPNPLWVIGNEVPQMYLGCANPENPQPPIVGLTSMIKRVDIAVYDIILEVVFGSWSGGEKIFNLTNGGLDYEINTDLLTIPGGILTQVEALKALIIAGTVTVPDEIYWT